MRLWSLHPRYLDAPGLTAAWREALLARAVLRGQTRGYRHHPQLERFHAHPTPRRAISAYLSALCDEADARGYAFARGKCGPVHKVAPFTVTDGQLAFEWRHLLTKLATRSPDVYERWRALNRPEPHPLFRVRRGTVAEWERP